MDFDPMDLLPLARTLYICRVRTAHQPLRVPAAIKRLNKDPSTEWITKTIEDPSREWIMTAIEIP